MQYKGTKKPIRQIAGELGVDALIEGSALREGGRVRITVQVIAGATDAHIGNLALYHEPTGLFSR
jgi:TolB-like protein